MPKLQYDELTAAISTSTHLIAVNLNNEEEQLDSLIDWCRSTEGVHRSGQMVVFRNEEAWVMFKLIWG